jgi:small subunit ribosomal protein S28e
MRIMPTDATPCEVVQVVGRVGAKGIIRVKARVLDGKDKGKILTRNVIGPLRLGDVLMVRETEMESVGSFGRR